MQSKVETGWESRSQAAADAELLLEQAFLPMLAHERKRSERSGSPFVLLLLNGGEAYLGEKGAEVVERIVMSMQLATRETDILGWYKTGQVLGIIFTEITELNDVIIEAILARVTAALTETLHREDMAKISLTCHLYPEMAGKPTTTKNVKLFFPELRGRRSARRAEKILKRGVDIAGSLAAMLLLSPVFLAIAVVVKLTSNGPILFRQKRIGQFGEEFTFLKFRSMFVNSDSNIHKDYVKKLISGSAERHGSENGKAGVFKITNDPRVTPIGRIMRRTSLDELPQFLNVLRGDMSLVGPRPPLPYEYECYDVWHRKRVFEVRPGITGLWQVNGRSRTNFDDMVRLDLQYARTWSVWLDIKILLRTPWAVFSGDGAY